jgi:hypothetical protein
VQASQRLATIPCFQGGQDAILPAAAGTCISIGILKLDAHDDALADLHQVIGGVEGGAVGFAQLGVDGGRGVLADRIGLSVGLPDSLLMPGPPVWRPTRSTGSRSAYRNGYEYPGLPASGKS